MELRALGTGWCGLSIAGAGLARGAAHRSPAADVSAEAFRFMDIRDMDLGMAPVVVGRISFTGDLGYEIWCEPDWQRYLFDLLLEAGEPHGIRLFGSRALNSLRLEKGFGSWMRDFRPIYGPLEAGLDRFVAYAKEADFIGKAAALEERERGRRAPAPGVHRRRDHRGRDRRRAGVARRRGLRVGDVGRVRAPRGRVRRACLHPQGAGGGGRRLGDRAPRRAARGADAAHPRSSTTMASACATESRNRP